MFKRAQIAPDEDADQNADELQLVVAAVGALLPGVLYFVLPDTLSIGPRWLLLVIEAVLVVPSLLARFVIGQPLPYRIARGLALALLLVVTAALIGSLVLLVINLPHFDNQAAILLRAAAALWSINVLTFGLWFWEVDGDGPLRRLESPAKPVDFLFPQHTRPDSQDWKPGFVDYVFVAFCFATALSPADTAPLSRRCKLLMMAEAVISLLIVVLLIGRSVNII
jgi:hypothetical protein